MNYTVTIEPNEKYRAVIEGRVDYDYDSAAEYTEKHPAPDAANAYLDTIDNAPSADDLGVDVRDVPLSWSDFSVASDPDVVKKIATYFDGMAPDEPTDLLRAKLRLVDCEVYANAQIAAQAELRMAAA